MRRIAACFIASTICAVVAWAWLAPEQPETASAIPPTPSWTNTPTPNGWMLHLDCDPGPGIPISCQYDLGSAVNVDVVLTNYTGSTKQIGTFNFTVVDSDAVDLVAIGDSGNTLNSNP